MSSAIGLDAEADAKASSSKCTCRANCWSPSIGALCTCRATIEIPTRRETDIVETESVDVDAVVGTGTMRDSNNSLDRKRGLFEMSARRLA